jgi:hypothetical protein
VVVLNVLRSAMTALRGEGYDGLKLIGLVVRRKGGRNKSAIVIQQHWAANYASILERKE